MRRIRGSARRSAIAGAVFVVAALAAAAPARADGLKIGVLRLASSGPVFIASEQGYFRDEGIEAELRFFEAAQPVALAVVSGDVDVGITGLTAGFYNLAGKGALKIVAAQSREAPGHHLGAYVASRKAYEAGLKRLADLPGHSVGITQIGSTFHYSLGRLAEKLGFDLGAIRLVPLQSMPNMMVALRGGQVDAALVPATVALPAVARGEAALLGWVGDETPWQVGAIFTSPRTIATRRPALEAFLRAYGKGAQDFHDAFLAKAADGTPVEGPQAQDILGILAKYTGQDPAGLRAGIPYIDPKGRLLVADIYAQVAWYKAQKLVDAGVDARSILDLSFVPDHFDAPK